MLAIILTILFFGITITIHELGHFVAAKRTKTKVNEFSIGMGPSVFHWGKGETKYSLRAFPIGGYIAMEGEEEESEDENSFSKKPVYKRMIIILSGAIMNILAGFILMGVIVSSQGQVASKVVDSAASYDDYQNPIKAGDTIKKINGIPILSTNDLQFELSRIKENDKINLTVKRDGKKVELNDVGYLKDENGKSSKVLGITLKAESINFKHFFPQTIGNSLFYSKLVFVSLGDLIVGKVPISELSGPVGIAQAVNQAKSFGVLSVLSLFAFLSINVGLFNLLPFPALDGGQFIFLLIELIVRRPVPRKIQQIINSTGLLLVLTLIALITIKDIFNLF